MASSRRNINNFESDFPFLAIELDQSKNRSFELHVTPSDNLTIPRPTKYYI